MTHEREKPDPSIVPGKPANKAGKPVAEPVQGREGAKGNTGRQSTAGGSVPQALDRVREAASARFYVKHPRQEPGALAAQAGIRAGGAG
jgi:hypothetical protein